MDKQQNSFDNKNMVQFKNYIKFNTHDQTLGRGLQNRVTYKSSYSKVK